SVSDEPSSLEELDVALDGMCRRRLSFPATLSEILCKTINRISRALPITSTKSHNRYC
ncbi:11615_t:CDS:2, partial [Funneliformis geosporum]